MSEVDFQNVDDFVKYAKEHLPKTQEEANFRYGKYEKIDPYPDILAALLNTQDIFKYVCTTGMIYPFYPNPDIFSGASYEVKLGGTVLYWDDEGKKQECDLTYPGSQFMLKPNSIAFVTLEPLFQIPNYIALRFNLKIKHIYKGLLLGTGPLVDPGFVGKLSIPLHNLTANTYEFKSGDGLIELEFTKISSYKTWLDKPFEQKDLVKGYYIPTNIPQNRSVSDYVVRAITPLKTVCSSIPEEFIQCTTSAESAKREAEQAKEDAKQAKDSAKASENSAEAAKSASESIDRRIKKWTLIGVIAAFISLVGFFVGLFTLIHNVNLRIDSVYNKIEYYVKEVDELQNENNNLYDEIEKLEDQVKNVDSPTPTTTSYTTVNP